MKEYINKIKEISKILQKCARWDSSKKSISNLNNRSNNGKDYIYEFYCYLTVLKDLKSNYKLEYVSGGPNKDKFPRGPAPKKDVPFFYLLSKTTKQKAYQVCAGTQIKAIVSGYRAPDISFQKHNADLDDPSSKDLIMIFDTKRKRPGSMNPKISEGQYSYFSTMIRELGVDKKKFPKIKFNRLHSFIGNCLITNNEAHSQHEADNRFHKLKEVEYYDYKADLRKVKVIG